MSRPHPLLPLIAIACGLLACAGVHAADAAPGVSAQASGPAVGATPPAKAAPPAPNRAEADAAPQAAPPGSMEALRRKLAARLGAFNPPDSPHPDELQVANQAAGAPASAPHRPPHRAVHRTGPHAAGTGHIPAPRGHWAYGGDDGPDAWARLSPEYAGCATGRRQSPIDIRDGIQVQLQPIAFDYHPGAFSVIDNGHTVQVDVAPGNALTIGGRRYELVQFHFHLPSEERIAGRQFDMEVHLVHKDAEGHLAVVAVLLERGAAQAVIQAVWNALPLEKNQAAAGIEAIDPSQLLPEDRRYYTYMGSLTTPPCSEGVLWMVMKQPVPVSAQQLGIFARLYPMNARPVQPLDGRLIKESE